MELNGIRIQARHLSLSGMRLFSGSAAEPEIHKGALIMSANDQSANSVKGDQAQLVLIVDDNLMSRKAVGYRLEKDGYRVAYATSGQDALDQLAIEVADLMFLDLVMEGMSGLDLLKKMKSDSNYSAIPVVMVSGVDKATSISECLEAGASDFLHKPVMAAALREISKDLVGSPRSAGVAEQVEEPGLDQMPLLEIAYIEQMKKDYGGETTRDFIARFEKLVPEHMNGIKAAAKEKKYDAWRHAAGGLKGGARTLGLVRLASVCRNIERACTNQRESEAGVATDLLQDIVSQSLTQLHAHAQSI
jgi:CheY-like chemotaxis protein